jgi:hypothetical protein
VYNKNISFNWFQTPANLNRFQWSIPVLWKVNTEYIKKVTTRGDEMIHYIISYLDSS